MDRAANSALLRRLAVAAGFDRAGVARFEPSATGGRLLEWLADGMGAGMAYLERRVECRLDYRELLPGAKSVVCAALQYAGGNDEGAEPEGDLWPRVARYARGRDYHDVMGPMLARLAAAIESERPGSRCRWYVDTGPLLERDLAAAAGVGVVGKNTNLLHPEAGSWFFLGQVLTTLEVDGEPRLADLCGQCSRCLEACPTGALPEAYRLDARLCISYWTIEHRGAVPAEVRPLLGDWVFGCDVCQEVCPVNRVGLPAASADFDLLDRRRGLGLTELLVLDEEGYGRELSGSAMKRAKRVGLQRNAAIAMGNIGDPRYVEPLARALATGEPMVREHAAWALGEIGDEEARRCLTAAASSDPDATVLAAIEEALRRSAGRSERARS